MNKFYTYIYYDNNDVPIYVGKGQKRRAWSHLTRKDRHPLTQKIQKMQRNGLTPRIEFLVKDVDEELAYFVEEEAIALYGRKDLGKGALLNLSDGGDGNKGCYFSPETRKAMSERSKKRKHTDEGKAKIAYANSIRIVTDETKEKLRLFNVGTTRSQESKDKQKNTREERKGTCLHCGAVMDQTNLKRWHNDNCKQKEF